jgi:hypothetical protein
MRIKHSQPLKINSGCMPLQYSFHESRLEAAPTHHQSRIGVRGLL